MYRPFHKHCSIYNLAIPGEDIRGVRGGATAGAGAEAAAPGVQPRGLHLPHGRDRQGDVHRQPRQGRGTWCVYLTTHSNIPISRRAMQRVSFYLRPIEPTTHEKPGLLACSVYSTSKSQNMFL